MKIPTSDIPPGLVEYVNPLAGETITDSLKRKTCLNKDACKSDACTPNDCRSYRTIVSIKRVKVTHETEDQIFIKCEVTNGEIGPFKPKEIIDVHTSSFEFAKELGVRPKDVWVALVEGGFGETVEYSMVQYFDNHGKFVPKRLADEIMKKNTFVTMMDNEETYVYSEGYYQPIGDILIKQCTREKLQDEYRKNRATEVADFVKASTYTKRKEEPSHLIPVDNGVLDLNIEPMTLNPHSPEFLFFNKIPVKYDPEADCPKIKEFFREITNSEEDVTILEETLGFCLYREYFLAKALMLVGDGSNGKSTFLTLANTFLGHQNVSGRSLQDLEEHRFAKADLHAKLANIYADLPDKALHQTGMFKMLTGRDLLSAEKKFQQPFHFVNYAKLLFSANKVPEAFDDTAAFFRRWVILVFPNVFTEENADPYILDKLTTKIELSGLLNLALAGLKKLLKNGAFSYSKTTEEVKEDYIRKSSPIAAFIMDCIETDSDAFIEKKALYAVFAEYCRNLSLPTVGRDTFFKNLPKHIAVADYRPKIKGMRFTSFKGIKYRLNMVSVSRVSGVSGVFFSLREKSDLFKNNGYQITQVPNTDFIKVGVALDRPDRVDTISVGEKLTAIRQWIIANRDPDDLVDALALADESKRLDLEPQKAIQMLKADAVIFDVRQVGKFGVVA